MGVVYSTLEVAEGRVPNDGDHLRAARLTRDCLAGLGSVAMVLVHGSVPEERSNVRSDLDVLTTYAVDSSPRARVLDEIKTILDEISAQTSVKIEANLWPIDDPLPAIEERMYDLLFSWHLAESMQDTEWMVGECDERILAIAQRVSGAEKVRSVAMNYVVYKADGFAKAPRLFNENDPRCLAVMQRGLELPKAAGRKASQLKVVSEGGEINDKLGLSQIADTLDDRARVALRTLIAIDREYTEMLSDTYDTEAKTQAYLEWLREHYDRIIHLGVDATAGLIRYVAKFYD